MLLLAEEQVRRDNPHFYGRVISFGVEKYESSRFDFIHKQMVGCRGNKSRAIYLWSPSRDEWCLGAN